MAAVSFGFSKNKSKQSTTLSRTADFADADAGKDAGGDAESDEREYLKDASEVAEERKKKAPEELVIPCRGNRIQLKDKVKKEQAAVKSEVVGNDADSAAARELLADAERWKEEKDAEEEEKPNANLHIPMTSAGEGEQGEDDEDEEDRTKESTLEDYDSVPVSGFGLGMLRGMGFKPGEGIGGFKKLDVKCLDPVLRPKGLGLGAARPNAGKDGGQKDSKKAGGKEGEELVMKRGAKVKVTSGQHREMYGEVDGMDEEAARVFVKLAVGGDKRPVSVSENAVRLVTADEYKKYSKVINRDLYDEYAEKQKEREDGWDDERKKRSGGKKRSRSRSPKSRSSSRPSSPKHFKKSSSKNGSYSSSSSRRDWLRPNVRVRFVDDKYKKGRYYKSKMVVDDVTSADRCSCRVDGEGSYLEDVRADQLETIVPKAEGAAVMVVSGRWRGRVGEMLKRDRDRCVAAVQLLPDRDEVVRLDFDDICEYIGDTADMEY